MIKKMKDEEKMRLLKWKIEFWTKCKLSEHKSYHESEKVFQEIQKMRMDSMEELKEKIEKAKEELYHLDMENGGGDDAYQEWRDNQKY